MPICNHNSNVTAETLKLKYVRIKQQFILYIFQLSSIHMAMYSHYIVHGYNWHDGRLVLNLLFDHISAPYRAFSSKKTSHFTRVLPDDHHPKIRSKNERQECIDLKIYT